MLSGSFHGVTPATLTVVGVGRMAGYPLYTNQVSWLDLMGRFRGGNDRIPFPVQSGELWGGWGVVSKLHSKRSKPLLVRRTWDPEHGEGEEVDPFIFQFSATICQSP